MDSLLSRIPMKPVRCPCCRLRIDGHHVFFHRTCAACGARFRLRRRYFLTTYVLAVAVSGGIASATGNRGTALTSLASLLLFPTLCGMVLTNLWLSPVDIAIVQEGWTPGDSEEDQELEREFELLRELDGVIGLAESESPAPLPGASTDDGRLPLSVPRDGPITFEGIAIALAFAALVAYQVYLAVEPHLP